MTAQFGPDGITNLPGGEYRRVIIGSLTQPDNTYVRFARCYSGTGYCGAMGFSIAGTTNNTVAGVTGIAQANHSQDGYINITSKSYYSGIKIKMVSNGNQDFDLYVAIDTFSTYSVGVGYHIWAINGNIQGHSDAGTAYSTCYQVTNGSAGVFASSGMASGSGPTTY